ncbi:uncharacterized protein BCR38DRAFT_448795 [Pseudomassariella vexata]|uniref:Uncharacterized protein n=1 Tax=Pseudomassariella vexata TaxID=1141098 RepID=A0A1Y2DEY7_9PEZI|nr:uncharacterized protein BCR38DRAFT_448795 [Pseudomassariella vexata]ORY57840.1 hypothetical protein BCR38DRAFT_448795 [Pseudomassariella vexata]
MMPIMLEDDLDKMDVKTRQHYLKYSCPGMGMVGRGPRDPREMTMPQTHEIEHGSISTHTSKILGCSRAHGYRGLGSRQRTYSASEEVLSIPDNRISSLKTLKRAHQPIEFNSKPMLEERFSQDHHTHWRPQRQVPGVHFDNNGYSSQRKTTKSGFSYGNSLRTPRQLDCGSVSRTELCPDESQLDSSMELRRHRPNPSHDQQVPSPPRTPRISRMPTPDLEPLFMHRFCPCCSQEKSDGDDDNDDDEDYGRWRRERAKMDQQINDAKAYIASKSKGPKEPGLLLDR